MKRIAVLAAVAALGAGCGERIEERSRQFLLERYPQATVTNAVLAPDGVTWCGEVANPGEPGRLFLMRVNARILKAFKDSDLTRDELLRECDIDQASAQGAALRARWSALAVQWDARDTGPRQVDLGASREADIKRWARDNEHDLRALQKATEAPAR